MAHSFTRIKIEHQNDYLVLIGIIQRNLQPEYIRFYKMKFIVYLTTRILVQTEKSFSSLFFHLPTGFCSSRTSINTKDTACGIGWLGGTRPTPEALRATGKECAWEGETTACAKQGRRREEIWTMSEMEESRSHVFIWVCDNSSHKMCPEISSGDHIMMGIPFVEEMSFRWHCCQALVTWTQCVCQQAHYNEMVIWFINFRASANIPDYTMIWVNKYVYSVETLSAQLHKEMLEKSPKNVYHIWSLIDK